MIGPTPEGPCEVNSLLLFVSFHIIVGTRDFFQAELHCVKLENLLNFSKFGPTKKNSTVHQH